jgi:hypothetical protein
LLSAYIPEANIGPMQAIRVGTARLAALGLKYCAHGIGQSPTEGTGVHSAGGAHTHGINHRLDKPVDKMSDETITTSPSVPDAEAGSQLIGAAILELGVIFHRCVQTSIRTIPED